MQRPRRRAVLVMRKLLTCTMCSMALVAVLSVPVQIFPSSRDVPIFSRSYRLPTVIINLQFISRMFFLFCLFSCSGFCFFWLFVSVAILFFLLILSSCHCFLPMRGLLLLFELLFILFRNRNQLYLFVLDFFTSVLFLASYSFFVNGQADCVVETLF